MKVNNKIIVVTGAGGGIGRQLVLQLLNKQAIVAAVDVNKDALASTRELVGTLANNLSCHQVDIGNRDAVNQLVLDVMAQHGCVDGIINNAGIIHPFIPLIELSDALIDRLINVNIYGVLNITRAFLPHLLERPQAHIANVSSMGGLFAFPNQTLYGACKAAVKLVSEGLFAELRDTQIGVSVIFPGATNTDITKNCDAHNEKIEKLSQKFSGTQPEEAARRIIRAIEKNRLYVHIGIDENILSRLYRLFPKTTVLLTSTVMKFALGDSRT